MIYLKNKKKFLGFNLFFFSNHEANFASAAYDELSIKKKIPIGHLLQDSAISFFEEEKIIRIRSVIMVERESQKGIVIGHKGVALKRVGTQARRDLEAFFGKQVHIELYVKVNKNWRSNQNQLRRFGYNN